MTEDTKRRCVKAGIWTSWLAALATVAVVGFLPLESTARLFLGPSIVLWVGVAIRLGMEATRYKLTDTVVSAMQVGFNLSEKRAKRQIEAAETRAKGKAEEMQRKAEQSWNAHIEEFRNK